MSMRVDDDRNRIRNAERVQEQAPTDAPAVSNKPADPQYADVPLDPLFLANLTATKGAAAAEPSEQRIDVGLDALAHTNASSQATGRPLSDYLSTLDGGGPKDLRPLTKALSIEKISSEDARTFAATGMLPPLRDASGAITSKGEDRTRALYAAASQQGSWTAVNSLTFLVGARRAVLQAEIASASGKPELAARVEQTRQFDKELGRGLQGIYAKATVAREHASGGILAHATTLERQADADPKRAPELRALASKLRDQGAQQAYSEAMYRAKMPKSGFDANASFAQAAEAQVAKGRAELRKPELAATPPESLSSAQKTANGVPGAARILDEAKPTVKADPRLLQVDFNRGGVVADFHQRHLETNGYFAPVDATGSARPRTPALDAHYDAMLKAKLDQHKSGAALVGTFGDTKKLTGERALEAERAQSQVTGVQTELAGIVTKAEASANQLRALGEKKRELEAASGQARAAQDRAKTDATHEREGSEKASKDKEAVFGDTFKTKGAARRDAEGVTDAKTTSEDADGKVVVADADVKRTDAELAAVEAQVPQLTAQQSRDFADADKVRTMLKSDPTLAPTAEDNRQPSPLHTALRRNLDAGAKVSAQLLDQAQKTPPKGEPARGHFMSDVGTRKLDLARYHVNATEVDAAVLGPVFGRAGAIPRLAEADALVADADHIRLSLGKGNGERQTVAQGIVETRAALATAHADYNPATSLAQINEAENVAKSDLPPAQQQADRALLGTATATSLVRSDVRFDQVLRLGNYDGKSQDALYLKAHKLLDGDTSPAARDGQTTLAAIDRSLNASIEVARSAKAQVRQGAEVEEARTSAAGRSEIQIGQMQVSGLITGAAYGISQGTWDIKEDMAETGTDVINQRTGFIRGDADRLAKGATEVVTALDVAKQEGHIFKTLGAIRIWSDRDNNTNAPSSYRAAARTIHEDSKAGGDGLDWQNFLRATVSGRMDAAPVAHALSGPVIGMDAAVHTYGDKFRGGATEKMAAVYANQLENVQRNTQYMYALMGANLVGEIAVATLVTAGVGDIAIAGDAAEAVNTARGASQALGGVRAAMTAARAAHPVMYAVGAGTAYGAGVMGASAVTHRLFGEHSYVSSGFDVATNFIPIGAEQKGIHVVSDTRKAAMSAERALAASEHGVSAFRAAVSGERLLVYAKFYGPQIALAGGQAVVSSIAVPVLAEHLGVRSQLGQAAIALAVNGVIAGGISTVQARGARTRAEVEAVVPTLVQGASREAGAKVTADVEGFLKTTEGRIPTSAEIASIRSRTLEHLGIPAEGGDATVAAHREQVSATLEGVRVQRVGTQVLSEIRGTSDEPLDAKQSALAVERIAERLGTARSDAPASRVQAFHDALAVIQSDPATPPEALAAAEDRVRAAEIAAGFAATPDNGVKPLLDNATQRGQVEKVLGEELGGLRAQVESGRGPSLTDASKSPSAFQRVAARLENEAGLGGPQAEAVLRAGQHDIVERTSVAIIQKTQANATHPLTKEEIVTNLATAAERSGLPKARALEVATEIANRPGMVEWVQSSLPKQLWPADMRRDRFLRVANSTGQFAVSGELSKLTAADYANIYPEGGPIPRQFFDMGKIRGFAAFAHSHPTEARIASDACTLGGPAINELQGATSTSQLVAIAKRWEPMIPTSKAIPNHPDYVLVERGPSSPSELPIRNIRPKTEHDPNGAFNQESVAGDKGTLIPNILIPTANHMLVRGPNGLQPLNDGSKVLIFSSHGGKDIVGESNQKSVSLVIEQIRAGRANGQKTEYVVLEACHQRDRRGIFSGDSNAVDFQKTLNQQLKAQGLPEVTVLAADKGGPLYGGSGGTRQPIKGWSLDSANLADANFVPANEGSRMYRTEQQAKDAKKTAAAVVVGTALVGATTTGAAVWYYRPVEAETPNQKKKKN